MQEKPKTNPEEVSIEEKDVTVHPQSNVTSEGHTSNSATASEGSVEVKSAEENSNNGTNEDVQTSPVFIETSNAEKESEAKAVPPVHFTVEEREEVIAFNVFHNVNAYYLVSMQWIFFFLNDIIGVG